MFAVVVVQNISICMALFGSITQHGGIVSAVLVGGLLFLLATIGEGRAHNDDTLGIKSASYPFFGDDICGTSTLPRLE